MSINMLMSVIVYLYIFFLDNMLFVSMKKDNIGQSMVTQSEMFLMKED
jgi:hypothetical protein